MSYFLVFFAMITLIFIFYVWYVTRYTHSIPDNQLVPLNTDDDKILIHWYNAYINHVFDFQNTDLEIAAKYLRRIHKLEINPNLLIVGTNLEEQYTKITGDKLEPKYSFEIEKSKSDTEIDPRIDKVDCIFDIRSTLGKNGEIAVIHNPRIRNILYRTNNLNLSEVNSIIDNDMDLTARDHIGEVLKFRWEQIRQLNDHDIINTKSQQGSYLYLRVPNESTTEPSNQGLNEKTITVLKSVAAMSTPRGARINLLCSNYEFESLIKRWKAYRVTNTELLPSNNLFDTTL
jgi:hypothetical protein